MPDSRPCPVCCAATAVFDRGVVLERYTVEYHRCGGCGLVVLPSPDWLDEAYSSAISDHDTGLLRRSRILSRVTGAAIRAEGLRKGRFLDWAGGYGVLTQLMRDRGFDYWHHDDFAQPLFARSFQDAGDADYDLITAFEVVEHLTDPRQELAAISKRTDRLLFTTELLPEPAPRVADWWYYLPETGQHVTFHTLDSLRVLGASLGYELTSNGRNLHMFHRVSLHPATRIVLSQRLSATVAAAGGLVRHARSRFTEGGQSGHRV